MTRALSPRTATTSALTVLVGASLFLASPTPASAESASCSATKVLRAGEELMRADGQVALFEMRVVRPETTRTLRMRFWFVNPSGGEERSLARVEAPAAERGVSSLRLGNKMWSFVPSTGRVQQVPESMMLSSWMGSDWTNDDLVREASLLDDYRARGCKVIEHEGQPAYRVDLKARPNREVAWQKMVYIANRGGANDMLPLEQQFFSQRAGELVLARTMSFADVREMGGRRLPARMILEPAGRPGRRTEMRYLSISFGADIPESIFSLRNLQRAR